MRKVLLIVVIMLSAANVWAADKFDRIESGITRVTTPGTPVQLSSTSRGSAIVYLSALNEVSHESGVYVGDAAVSAGGAWGAVTTRRGTRIISTDTIPIQVADLNMLYVDAAHSQDGVTWTIVN